MFENISVYDQIKLNGILKVSSTPSPKLNKAYIHRVAMTISLNNIFCKEFQKAMNRFSDMSLVSILNTQLTAFQLKDTERLNDTFSKLLYKVSKLYRTKYSGGRKRAVFDEQYTEIAIYRNELENVRELNCKVTKFDSEKLKLEKRCKELLSQLEEFRSAPSTLADTDSKSSIEFDELREENKKLMDYIESFQKDVVLKNTGKTLEELHPNSKRRKIVALENVSQKALWFAETFGLTPKSVKCETKTGEICNLNLSSKQKLTSFSDMDNEEKTKLRELVAILDRFQISSTAYKELSLYFDEMPRSYLIGQCRDDINSFFHIERTPGNIPGAYLSFTEELKKVVHSIYSKSNTDYPSKIQVKFSGDGTRVSRVSNFIVFSFSIIDSDQSCGGDSHTIGLVSCSETYQNLKIACSPILAELNSLNSAGKICVDDKEFDLEIFIGSDVKFIQLLLGLCGSTGIYACPWCKIHKSARADTSKTWNYYHLDDNKRTISNLKLAYTTKAFGTKDRVLINIEPDHIIIDELHLMLRIFDVLLRNVIEDAVDLDQNSEVLQDETSHLKSLVEKIRSCGVSFNTWTSKKGDLEWTSLTGNDAKKILKLLPSKLFFDIHHKTHDKIVQLWEDFGSIHTDICKESIELISGDDIFQRFKVWLENFVSIGNYRKGYQPHNVTPYMHSLVYHVPFFIHKYGHLGKFSGQGVEKNNDVIKTIHMSQTNRYDGPVDALKVAKRREWCAEEGYVRQKRHYKKTSGYWESEIFSRRASKKYRILNEIKEKSECVRELFQREVNDDIKDYSNMSVQEIKSLLKDKGIVTKVRKREKLIALLEGDKF